MTEKNVLENEKMYLNCMKLIIGQNYIGNFENCILIEIINRNILEYSGMNTLHIEN